MVSSLRPHSLLSNQMEPRLKTIHLWHSLSYIRETLIHTSKMSYRRFASQSLNIPLIIFFLDFYTSFLIHFQDLHFKQYNCVRLLYFFLIYFFLNLCFFLVILVNWKRRHSHIVEVSFWILFFLKKLCIIVKNCD